MKVMEISQVSDLADFLRALSFLVPIEDPNYGHLLMTIFYIQKINILLKIREGSCEEVSRSQRKLPIAILGCPYWTRSSTGASRGPETGPHPPRGFTLVALPWI